LAGVAITEAPDMGLYSALAIREVNPNQIPGDSYCGGATPEPAWPPAI